MNVGVRLTANEVKATLGLEPHPTCGFVAETYRSPLKIPAAALPEAYDDGGDRPYGSALYYLSGRPRRPDSHALHTLGSALPPTAHRGRLV